MKTILVNLTGNRDNFENNFCANIINNCKVNIDLCELMGLSLFESANLINNYDFVLVVAHASNNKLDNCIIDTGLNLNQSIPVSILNMLNSPSVLSQILGKNTKKYILFYCACSALSAELITSATDDPNCIGIISSKDEVSASEFAHISKIIEEIHNKFIDNVISTKAIIDILNTVNMPNLFYCENTINVEETDV
ncbi:MAG: hypothetical protein JEY94_00995 [Melioribacteraceae bacterium]|nr:hypothetical protein [Melioribacteraceae bacterium]